LASISPLAFAACGSSSDSTTALEDRIATLEQSLADAEDTLDAPVHVTMPRAEGLEVAMSTVSPLAASPPPSTTLTSTPPPSTTLTPTTATPTTTAPSPYVLPAGGALTERQAEMVTVAGKYIEAIRANDGDRAVMFMTADAYLEYTELDEIFRVSDGRLQEHFDTLPEYGALHPYEPIMVVGDRLIISGIVDNTEARWLSIIRFTSDGPVLVMSEHVYV